MRLLFPLFLAITLLTQVSAQDSFCVKYAKALFNTSTPNTNYRLIQAVVARTVIGCNNDIANAFGVPGVAGGDYDAFKASTCGGGITKVPGLVEDPLNAPFFTGNVPAYTSLSSGMQLNSFGGVNQTGFPGIRFVAVSGQSVQPFPATLGGNVSANTFAEGLVTHLIAFFGSALGCNPDNVTSTVTSPIANGYIGKYNGATDMTAVHKDMKITQAVWNEFVSTFNLTLRSFGVAQADIDATVVPIVASFLRGPAGVTTTICNQADCACAPKYINVNGACVATTVAPGTTTAPPTTTTSPPTTPTNGTKAPTTPPKNSATMMHASAFIMASLITITGWIIA